MYKDHFDCTLLIVPESINFTGLYIIVMNLKYLILSIAHLKLVSLNSYLLKSKFDIKYTILDFRYSLLQLVQGLIISSYIDYARRERALRLLLTRDGVGHFIKI